MRTFLLAFGVYVIATGVTIDSWLWAGLVYVIGGFILGIYEVTRQ